MKKRVTNSGGPLSKDFCPVIYKRNSEQENTSLRHCASLHSFFIVHGRQDMRPPQWAFPDSAPNSCTIAKLSPTNNDCMYFYALHGQLTADYVPTRCHRMAVLAYCVATVVFAPSPCAPRPRGKPDGRRFSDLFRSPKLSRKANRATRTSRHYLSQY